jgi:hypothetical protein
VIAVAARTPQTWRRFVPDLLAVLLLLALAFKLSYDVAAVRDLLPGDDAGSMSAGLSIPEHGLPPAAYGPLYCLWFYLLSLLQPDRVQLYYLSWSLLALLISMGLYALCRSLGGTRSVALVAAFLGLTSNLVDVWPYTAHLGTVLLLFGTAAAIRLRSLPWAVAGLVLTLLLAGYVRPEFYLAFLLGCLVAGCVLVWAWLRRPDSRLALVGPGLLVATGAAGLGWGLGVPLGDSRSFIAFMQHYAVNTARVKHLPGNPWVHAADIFRADFGNAQTFAQALRTNPRAVAGHVAANAGSFPGAFLDTLMPNLDLSRQVFAGLCFILAGAVVLAVAALGYRLLSRRTPVTGRQSLALALGLLGLLLVPVLAAALLIAPRSHYLMPAAAVLIALAGAGLSVPLQGRPLGARLDTWPALLVLGAVLLAVTPNRAHGWDVQQVLCRHHAEQSPPRAEQALANTLRALDLRGPVVLLDFIGPIRAFYAGVACRCVYVTEKTGPFWEFVHGRGINVIVLDGHLLSDSRYRDDPEFQDFASGKKSEVFTFVPVPDGAVRIAVRNDLLPR